MHETALWGALLEVLSPLKEFLIWPSVVFSLGSQVRNENKKKLKNLSNCCTCVRATKTHLQWDFCEILLRGWHLCLLGCGVVFLFVCFGGVFGWVLFLFVCFCVFSQGGQDLCSSIVMTGWRVMQQIAWHMYKYWTFCHDGILCSNPVLIR